MLLPMSDSKKFPLTDISTTVHRSISHSRRNVLSMNLRQVGDSIYSGQNQYTHPSQPVYSQCHQPVSRTAMSNSTGIKICESLYLVVKSTRITFGREDGYPCVALTTTSRMSDERRDKIERRLTGRRTIRPEWDATA